jgi:hypothetical protein
MTLCRKIQRWAAKLGPNCLCNPQKEGLCPACGG